MAEVKGTGKSAAWQGLSPGVRLSAITGAGVLLALFAVSLLRGGDDDIAPGTTFVAKRGDLHVTVVEGGSVEAIESQEIRSEIKGHSGVKILSIVEEGYLVTRDDVESGLVLVELDSADLRDKLVNQEISFQSAQAQYIEKQAQYDIQVNQNQSNITAAELTSKFALMDFQKFLGEKAVGSIVSSLNLDRKATELQGLKATGGMRQTVPEPQISESEMITKGVVQGEGGEWPGRRPQGEAQEGRGGGRPSGEGAPGGRRGMRERRGGPPGGFGGFGGQGGAPGGGGMDPEGFKKMIEGNGGQMPEAMAERMRQMGMDPNMMLERMGITPGGDKDGPKVVDVDEQPSAPRPSKPTFTMEPEYVSARKAIVFAAYADDAKLEDGEAKQQLRDMENDILVSRENLRLAQTRLEGQERLAARDFITQNDLERERLSVETARIQLEKSITGRNLYIQYTFEKEAEQLLSDYEEALMNLERTMQEAGAKLSQAEAGLRSAERKYNLEGDQLADYQDQIDKCVIRAKRPGLVVYGSSTDKNPFRRSSEEPIQEGTTVRQRQKIITIPDMTQMGITVNIHESAVQRVGKGKTVKINVDAFPERPLTGMVERVAVLADSANMFMNPDLKVYPTMVRIDGIHDWLRPGMSTQVEILIETLNDVVYIPIQAVTYFGDEQVCYVIEGGNAQRRVITTGLFTQEFIEVSGGLQAGEEVMLLAPGAGEQDDLGGEEAPAEAEDAEVAGRTPKHAAA